MADQIDRIASRQRLPTQNSPFQPQFQQPPASYPPYPPYTAYQFPPPPPPQPTYIYQPSPAPSNPPSIPPPLLQPPVQAPPSQILLPHPQVLDIRVLTPRSSPIGSQEEEEEIIEQFFLWKINRTQHPGRKDRIGQVQRIVSTQMWSIDDLKGMSDPSSSIYNTAMRLDIPDGMARGFKEELKAFKPQWRQAKALIDMGRR
ncbi:hypothetical protein MMC14_005700 [Varicellaria rhodocarpa]|nr:hypothetical protein [Varicellaria rhodocarpa]